MTRRLARPAALAIFAWEALKVPERKSPDSVYDPYQTAVLESRGPFCVTAGAGSGKTGTLVEYLMRYVEEDPQERSLTKALVVTFSEKAAAELKERVAKGIAARLRAASAAGEAASRAIWERELRRLGQSQISTIHSYARSIVAGRAHLLGVSGELLVEAEAQVSDLRACLDDLLEENNPDLLFLLSVFPLAANWGGPVRPASITSFLESLLQRQSSWGLSVLKSAMAGPPQEEELCGAVAALRGSLERAANFLAENPAWAEGHQAFASMAARSREAIVAPDKELARDPARLLAKLKPLIADGQFGNLGAKGKALKDAILDSYASLLSFQSAREAEPVAAALVRLSNLAYQRVKEGRLRRGRMTFDDLLAMARDLLKTRSDLRAREAGRFSLVMVDEFQDTNRLQTDLLAQLLSNGEGASFQWESLDWRSLQPKLKVVGDPKQSIYRFRGSEPGIMEALAGKFKGGGGDCLPLSVNYRTQAPLVDFLNALFSELLSAQEDYRLQEPSREGLYSEPPAVWLKVPPAPKGRSGLGPDFQAKAIVSYLGDLFSGKAGVLVADKGPKGAEGPKRLPGPGDVAILLRKRKNAQVYQEAITRAGWRCHTLKGREWFGAPEIRGLAAAYLYLAGREPDYNLFLALSSPLGPVSERGFLTLAWPTGRETAPKSLSSYFASKSAPWPAALDSEDRAILDEVRSLFLILKPLTLKRPAGETIEALVEERRLLPLIIGGPGGSPERVKDVQSFMARVKDLPRTEPIYGGSEADLIELMRKSDASAKDEEDAAGDEADLGSVNIMTVHASKGLEFPVVVIAEADGLVPGQDRNLVISDDGRVAVSYQSPSGDWRVRPPQFDELRSEDKAFADKEAKRLLYVACTRARDHLVLVGREFKTTTVERWLALVANSGAFQKMGRVREFTLEELDGGEASSLGASSENASSQEGLSRPSSEASLEPQAAQAAQEAFSQEGLSRPSSEAPGAPAGEETGHPSGSSLGYNPLLIGPLDTPRRWAMSATRYCAVMDFVSKRPEWRQRLSDGDFPPLELPWETDEEDDELDRPAVQAKVGPDGPTEAPQRGTLFHAVMELTDFDWSEAQYLDALSKRAKAMGLAPSSEELVFLASRALLFQEDELGKEAAAALREGRMIRREWPFWLRLDSDELGPGVISLSGMIDLFFVDSLGRGRIVDYKLSGPRNHHRGAYKRQKEVYRRAVQMAGFLEPDQILADLWYSEN
jgi:ATP-dependent helicase/nuclease subunit A